MMIEVVIVAHAQGLNLLVVATTGAYLVVFHIANYEEEVEC